MLALKFPTSSWWATGWITRDAIAICATFACSNCPAAAIHTRRPSFAPSRPADGVIRREFRIFQRGKPEASAPAVILLAQGNLPMADVETKLTQELPESVLATLAEIGEEINASLNLDRVLSKMATLIKRLIDYEIFTVMLLDERSQMLLNRFAVGYSQEMMENWRIPVGQGISGAAAGRRQPIRVADVRNDPRYINSIDSVRSELSVPLLFKNQVVGVIDIQSSRVDYFTSEQQEILVLLASRLATAIENARLFERARSQADTLLLLHEVGREASSILDVEALLRRAAELVKRVIDYQIMSIMLYDRLPNRFLQRLAVKYGQSAQGKLAVGLSEGIIGVAAST